MNSDRQIEIKQKSGHLVRRLILVVVGMFGFGFALVPLYDVFCDVTGLNGKTQGQYVQSDATVIDESRWVTVQFMANNNDGMSWAFKPEQRSIKVHPGALNSVAFYAKNPSHLEMVAQAVPSVSPFRAAEYLHKTECFCFKQQKLAAGEQRDMPLRFIVDRDLPEEINTFTLSYTLFDITQLAASD